MKQTIDNFSKTDVITASNSNAGHLASLKARRKLWLEVHLWLGLALGLFLSIFGITGSILVFHAEINELLNPQLLTVAVPDGNPVYKPLAEIFQAGQAAMPKRPHIRLPLIHVTTKPLSSSPIRRHWQET